MNRLAFVALAILASACGDSPTAPSKVPPALPAPTVPAEPGPAPAPTPVPVPAGPVMAPPPIGVSAEVWRVAFAPNSRLYRPDAVHLDVASFGSNIQDIFAEMAAAAAVQSKTTFDLIPGGIGADFAVSLKPGLICGGFGKTAACTTPTFGGDGRVMGGTMEFTSIAALQDRPLVLHEMFWTLGLTGPSPKSGLLSMTPWPQPRLSDEEHLMVLGRYDYPLLAVYSQ